MHPWVIAGEIIRVTSHGEGLVVRCTSGLSSVLYPGLLVFFVPPQLDAPRSGIISRVVSGSGMTVTLFLNAMDDDGALMSLVGCNVLIDASDLPVSATLTQESVAGYTVQDDQWGKIGVVRSVISGPAQQLLEVDTGEKLVYIPAVEAFVRGRDAASSVITVSIPRGILEL